MSVTKEQIQKTMDTAFSTYLKLVADNMDDFDESKTSTRRVFEAGYQAGRTDGYKAGVVAGADWGADRHWR